MSRLAAKVTYALAMTLLLSVAFASFTSAWSLGTSCSTSTYKICVSYDDNNGLPRATTNYGDNDYWGDNYYNSITTINNTVSSVRNLYSYPTNVMFYDLSGYAGSSYCLPPNYTVNDLGWWGFWPDDHFSSHLLASYVC